MSVHAELRKLVEDIYQEGYVCGGCDDHYFEIWVACVERVVAGAEYTDEMWSEELHKRPRQ